MKAATVPHLGTEDASFPRNELTNLQKASDAHDATPPSLAVGASSPIPLTFPQFAAAYSSRLPQIVKLGGDYIDPMGNRVVQSGETLKVLHIKNATVADTQVYRGDTTVTTVTTVLNSRDRISIIYVPDNDLNRALAGVTFKTVQHMCQAKQMPKAVGVLKAWRNDETFIDKYDVLILRKKYKRRGKSGVHAFSTRYKNDLFLPDSCNGMFTTVPDMVSLRLTEITSLLSDILPVTVYNVINKQCLTLIRHEVQPVIFAQVVDHHPPLELELPVSDSFLRFIVRHPPSTTVARDVLGTATGLGNIKEPLGNTEHSQTPDASYVKFSRQQDTPDRDLLKQLPSLDSSHTSTAPSPKHPTSESEAIAIKKSPSEGIRLADLLTTTREPFLATKTVLPSKNHHGPQAPEEPGPQTTLRGPPSGLQTTLGVPPTGPQTVLDTPTSGPQTTVGVPPSGPKAQAVPNPTTQRSLLLSSPQTTSPHQLKGSLQSTGPQSLSSYKPKWPVQCADGQVSVPSGSVLVTVTSAVPSGEYLSVSLSSSPPPSLPSLPPPPPPSSTSSTPSQPPIPSSSPSLTPPLPPPSSSSSLPPPPPSPLPTTVVKDTSLFIISDHSRFTLAISKNSPFIKPSDTLCSSGPTTAACDKTEQPTSSSPCDKTERPTSHGPHDKTERPTSHGPHDKTERPTSHGPHDKTEQPTSYGPHDKTERPTSHGPHDKTERPTSHGPHDKTEQPTSYGPHDKTERPTSYGPCDKTERPTSHGPHDKTERPTSYGPHDKTERPTSHGPHDKTERPTSHGPHDKTERPTSHGPHDKTERPTSYGPHDKTERPTSHGPHDKTERPTSYGPHDKTERPTSHGPHDKTERPTSYGPHDKTERPTSYGPMATTEQHHSTPPDEAKATPPLPPSGYQPLCDQLEEGAADSEEEDDDIVQSKPHPPPLPPGYTTASDVLTLQELLWLHSDSLPLDVLVHSGAARRLPENEAVTVHRPKYSQVIIAESSEGCLFDIPLNTEMRFALLYDPLANTRAAVRGFVLKGVRSVLYIHPRPKMVCSKEDWTGKGVSIASGEILILESVQCDRGALAVYSLLTRTHKFLPVECASQFTTGAIHLCMHLCDILGYVPAPFPDKACILKYDRGPKCYGANVVTLRGVSRAPVLYCVPIIQPSSENGQPVAFVIPHNLPNLGLVIIKKSDKSVPNEKPSQALATPPSVATPPFKITPTTAPKRHHPPGSIAQVSSPVSDRQHGLGGSDNQDGQPNARESNIDKLVASFAGPQSAAPQVKLVSSFSGPQSAVPVLESATENDATTGKITFDDFDWSDSSDDKAFSYEEIMQPNLDQGGSASLDQGEVASLDQGGGAPMDQEEDPTAAGVSPTLKYTTLSSRAVIRDQYSDLVHINPTTLPPPRSLPPRKIRSNISLQQAPETPRNTLTNKDETLSNEDAYIHMSSASPPVHSPPVDMGYKGHKVPVEIRRKAPPSIALLHSRDSLTPTPQIPTYSIPSAHTSSVSNMLAAPRSPLTSSPNPVRAHSPFNVPPPVHKVGSTHAPVSQNPSLQKRVAPPPIPRNKPTSSPDAPPTPPSLYKPISSPDAPPTPPPPHKPTSSSDAYQKLVPTYSVASEYTRAVSNRRAPFKSSGSQV